MNTLIAVRKVNVNVNVCVCVCNTRIHLWVGAQRDGLLEVDVIRAQSITEAL